MTPTQRKAIDQAIDHIRSTAAPVREPAHFEEQPDGSLIPVEPAPEPVALLTNDEIAEAGRLNVEGERMLPYSYARAIEQAVRQKAGIVK